MNYARIQAKIDHGLGIAGRHLGQPFSVYRPNSPASGDFPGGWSTIATNAHIYRERISETKIELAIPRAALCYHIFGDTSPYLLGDVMLCTDPAYEPGISYGAGATTLPGTQDINAIMFAWHMPAFIPVGMRLDHLVRIYRPSGSPATLNDGSKYWESTLDNDLPLKLAAGAFSFGTAGAGGANIVPAGFASAYRPSGAMPFGPPPPGMIRPTHWYVTLPPLPGYEPTEGDAIVTIDDARYVVVDPYRQEAGVVGSPLLCDRQISQTG